MRAKYDNLSKSVWARLFSCDALVDTLEVMNEYLDICDKYSGLVNPKVICQHLKNMIARDVKMCVLYSHFLRGCVDYSRIVGLGTPHAMYSRRRLVIA
jgi:hypothetical protein